MKEDLVERFEKEEEKEELRRYGIKKKQKKKTRINLIINIESNFRNCFVSSYYMDILFKKSNFSKRL